MTEIALRAYNQEIKDLIDHGHFDEAIAHCQHVLESFPRHIETYRLLGKAFLEQGRHGDAADVFQRVLSAIPEDWLSHVAMAIVREDESNLDMAIWHMERAYEVNPSNPTVQQEVRRLRGRRDGVEPPKLRLTRSALARMYIKGGLYGQAIAEIRGALSEDPDRPDLQVLLASALYDSGAIQEAADLCNTLLQKLPYCLEANRILGLVLLATDKAEDAEKLFQRIESLDPHIDIEILKKDKRIAEHPGQMVSLSRLEYEGQEKTVRTKQQPSWASSLGLKIEEPQQKQAIPDWLAAASQSSAASPSTPKPAESSAESAAAIPSWLEQASAAVTPPVPSGPSIGTPAEPPIPIARTATGELPDWIQKQAIPAETPPERTSSPLPDWLSAAAAPPETASPVSATATGDALPDWLAAAAAAPMADQPVEPKAPAGTAEQATGNALPDWIKTSSLTSEPPKEKISDIPDWLSTPPPPAVDALPPTSLPEWSRPETKTGPLEIESGNIPDWLSSSQPTSSGVAPEQEWMKEAPKPPSDAMPEWMKGVSPAEPQASVQPSGEDVPDWLRETTAPAAKPVELVPEWMRGEASAPAASPPKKSAGKMPPPEEDIPEWMKPEPSEVPVLPPSKPIFGAKTEPPAEAPSAPPSAPTPAASAPEVDLPDWMKAASSPEPAAEKPREAEPEAAPAEEIPDWLKGAAPSGIQPAAMPVEGAESPAAAEERPPAEPVPDVDMPDWLKAVPARPPAPVEAKPSVEAPVQTAPAVEIPDWLKGGPSAAAAESGQPKAPAEVPAGAEPEVELPDWLRDASSVPASGAVAATPVVTPSSPPSEAVASAEAPETPFISQKSAPPKPPQTLPGQAAEEPGPAHATPTAKDGIDLPDWLVTQLQGKPNAAEAAPAAAKAEAPLPDWLRPANSGAAAPVVDWEKAASQPLPAAPVDATRPAKPAEEKPAGGAAQVPGWLDKSKPTGSDTVARWLDRRLKTSTLSSLDEAVLKSGVKPSTAPPPGRTGTGTQLPTWLDAQKPGASDTVVRWMDKRETGSLRKTPTATFSSVSKAAAIARGESLPPSAETPAKSEAPAPVSGSEDTVTSKRSPVESTPVQAQPAAAVPFPAPVPPKPPAEPRIPKPAQAEATVSTAGTAAGEDDEGEFVPPPEWLQKALGSAVADVPPIPKKQTGNLKPGTVSPVSASTPKSMSRPAAPPEKSVAAVSPPPAEVTRKTVPAEESEPAAVARPGAWVPLAPQAATAPTAPEPAPAAAKPEKAAKKSSRKKARKITAVEAEAIIREARIYLETDLQKASEAYQQVIEDPERAEIVAGDLTTYLEQDPASPQLWNLLGDACSRAGRLQDAYRAYAEALRRM
ncbi:MAG: tetratricopeptide repeat protein [Anaerolineales bacterium]|nr:tetratricopeptide repeat protein [Anaerolineales bacterium]